MWRTYDSTVYYLEILVIDLGSCIADFRSPLTAWSSAQLTISLVIDLRIYGMLPIHQVYHHLYEHELTSNSRIVKPASYTQGTRTTTIEIRTIHLHKKSPSSSPPPPLLRISSTSSPSPSSSLFSIPLPLHTPTFYSNSIYIQKTRYTSPSASTIITHKSKT